MAGPLAAGAGAVAGAIGNGQLRRNGRAIGGGILALLAAVLLLAGVPAMLVGTGVICPASSAAVAAGAADPPDLSAVEIAERIYDVAVEMKMSERHLVSAYITVLVESGGGQTMRNLACDSPGECDGDSVGAFQQRNLPEWTKQGRDRRNVSDAARSYFEAVYRYQRPGMSAGQIAVAVQRMAEQYAHRYLTAQVEQRAGYFLRLVLQRKDAVASGSRPTEADEDADGAGARAMASPVATAAANPTFTSTVAARARDATHKTAADAAGNTTEQFHWPTEVRAITSPYGMRNHPITGTARMHTGVDIGAPAGAEIHAVLSGIIVLAQSEWASGGYGNFVCVRHSQQLTTCYAHMQSAPTLAVGSPVSQGATVGRVGSTGSSTAPHLHFEVRLGPTGSSPITDPAPYLGGAASFSGNNGGQDGLANACLIAFGTPATRAGYYQGGELSWPLQGGGGTIGSGSNQAGGTHDPASPPNNWQSDNALDIVTPIGTPVVAVADGEICASCGFGAPASSNPRMAGLRLTLNVAGNQIYYAHLSRYAPGIGPGSRVKKGDVLGFSGAAGGPPPVPHLHIGVSNGRPEDLFGVSNV